MKSLTSIKGHKKSSGNGSILNEMLKYGQCCLLQGLHQLFNLEILSTNYLSLWSYGLLTPLHKKGIIISSCIG